MEPQITQITQIEDSSICVICVICGSIFLQRGHVPRPRRQLEGDLCPPLDVGYDQRARLIAQVEANDQRLVAVLAGVGVGLRGRVEDCLLYTSDAADE